MSLESIGWWCSRHLCSRRPVAIANLIVARTASMSGVHFCPSDAALPPRWKERLPRFSSVHCSISLRYHPQPLFRHHPSFAKQNKKSTTKTHQLHLQESQPKYIATQKKLPLLIIKMIGCDDSDLIRLCGVRDLCVLCYGNVVSLIAKFLTALCLVFWSLSLTTT